MAANIPPYVYHLILTPEVYKSQTYTVIEAMIRIMAKDLMKMPVTVIFSEEPLPPSQK